MAMAEDAASVLEFWMQDGLYFIRVALSNILMIW